MSVYGRLLMMILLQQKVASPGKNVAYYESLKRDLKTKTIYGFRCDERLKN